eukprot:scaffold324_cov394-Prasinococcus_capsulatus_cf.AAC.9
MNIVSLHERRDLGIQESYSLRVSPRILQPGAELHVQVVLNVVPESVDGTAFLFNVIRGGFADTPPLPATPQCIRREVTQEALVLAWGPRV